MSKRASVLARRFGALVIGGTRGAVRRVALGVVVAVLASTALVQIAPPAFAADACSTALVGALDGPTNSIQAWTSGLATVGKLAESLPGVGTSAGSVLGFTDLVHKWFDSGSTKLNAATSCDQLNLDEPIDLGGSDGRAGHLTSVVTNVTGGKQVAVTITAAKTLHNQALGIPVPIGGGSSAPQTGFSSQGGVDLTTTATLSFSLVWLDDGGAGSVYVVADNSTPSLHVDAAAHFATLSAVKAAIGILGVEVKAGSTLDLEAHFKGTVSDPNNDGKLEFSGGAAELSQPGSLAGLVSFGFDSPAGHLNAHLLLGAAASANPSPIPLPAIDATIDLNWADLTQPMPTSSPGLVVSGLDVAGKFLNMTPRDLADGIGQLVTSLTMMQRSNIGNLELPFMKGTLADAIQLNESLKKFLKDNTVDPALDPAQGGHPTFVSLQQFFDRMTTITVPGTSLTVSNVLAEHFDTTSPTISFKVSLDRAAPASAIDLNAAAAAASGGPGTIYTATTLKDPNQTWKANEWAGRHVVAGTSGATVASNTTDTITFAVPTTPTVPGQAWAPTVPTNGSPYSISGMNGDVGVVALGDALKTSGKGVGQANSINATAKVTPSYHAEITLVLDLQNPTHHDPPIDINGDGSTLVSDTPTGSDRVKLRTSDSELFHADFPMDAGIDLFANAGFLQIRLQGAMSVSKKSGATNMLKVSLKNQGDLTFHQVVDKLLHAPGTLLDFDIGVAGAGSVTATVPGAPSFFASAATASFDWGDITTGTPQFHLGGLSKLTNVDFDPTNPKQLFAILLKTLQTLDQALGQGETTGTASIFSQKIPVLGRSLRDLLRADESGMGDTVTYGSNFVQDTSRSSGKGNAFPSSLKGRSIVVGTQVGIINGVTDNKLTMFSDWSTAPTTGTAYVVRSELDDVISILQNNPSDNLQALVDLLNKRLGHNSPVEFSYYEDTSGGTTPTPSLLIKLDWKRSFHTSSPVQFDFDLPGLSDLQLVGVQGKGQVSLGAGGEIKIGLVVPLAPGDGPADAGALKILDDSSIGVKLDALVSGSLATTIGPLSLSLGDPSNNATDTVKAQAKYSLDLAKPGVSTPTATSFSSFLGAVGPTLNASTGAVNCDLPDETTSSNLALCANLPLYISTGSGYSKLIDPGANAFEVRLPKTTSPTSNYFDLGDSAGDIDGHHRLVTPDATELANAIQSHLIDLTRIDGIDGFLNLLIQSLNAASFGGKLPLVGDDLQQGADFLSNLKQTIDNAIGDLATVGSMGELRDWVNGQLHDGLHDAGLNPDTASIDTTCSTTLDSPTPTVTPSPSTPTVATVTYAVVAYVVKSGEKVDAQPAVGSAQASTATVDASHTNKISWTSVNDPNGTGAAAGYKIYRKVGADFLFLIDLSGAAQHEYVDDNSPAPTAGSTPTNTSGPNPKFTDCGITYLDSVQINLNVSQGNFSGDYLNCNTGNPCTTGTVPLDIGIPGLSLRAATPGDGPSFELGWRLHLAFGISRSQGFFVDTTNVGTEPEFAVGLNLTLPDEINAQLAFINISAKNCTTAMTNDCLTSGLHSAPAPGAIPAAFGGTFKIDILAPNDPTDHHLTLADLSDASLDSLFDVRLFAGVNIDWLLKARPGTDGPIAGFPGIQAEFQLKWSWNNAKPGANTSDTVGNQPLWIAFQRVQIDAGEVFSGIIGPVVNQIKFVTGPLDPVVKTLYAPIPVLSDLSHLVGGDDVTIISLAKAFSTIAGGPDLTFVDTIAGVVNFINKMPTCTTSCLIPIGSFEVAGQKAIDNPSTPSNSGSLIENKKDKNGDTAFPSALGDLDNASTGTAVNLVDEQAAGEAKAGFTFPVFQNPSSLFNLIMGGDVDLVKFDSGNLRLGFDWNQQFGPVYAPPPVFVTLHGSADVTLRIVAGFDTYGIRKAFEKVRDTGEFNFDIFGNVFLQSLFFYTTDKDGKPLPVVTFHGEIAAGAAVSAVVITVGIEGGVSLTISFLWNDPNHDGKFRISEFLQAALNNPICLFSVSGKISVFLRAYITIGFSPFSVSFSFTIVDVTLLDFSVAPDCSPPPPKLGGVTDDGTTLIVYAGALGHTTQRGHSSYESDNEEKDTVKVTSLHDYTTPTAPSFRGIAVEMLGIRREFLNPNIQRVMVVGSGPGVATTYAKPMIVTFLGDGKEDTTTSTVKPPTANFDREAIVFGGSAKDKIKTGIGDSWIDGNGDDDVISTSDKTVLDASNAYVLPNAKAIVAGGGGVDSISVGNGNDTVAGDSAITTTGNATKNVTLKELGSLESGVPATTGTAVTVPDWTQLVGPDSVSTGVGEGGDTINAGLGQNNLYGNGGDDTIGIGADNALAPSVPACASGPCDFKSKGATIVGGYGNDHLAGGTANDAIYTGDKTVTTFDSDGGNDYSSTPTTNTVDTGTGSDTVYGSKGVDIVSGHSIPPHSPATTDTIYGGAANDILVGGYGPDSIFGGPGDDYVIAEPSNVDIPASPPDDGFGPQYTVTHIAPPAGTVPQFKTLVGGDGRDHIIGGDGGANIDGDRYNNGSDDAHSRCIAGTERNPAKPVASDPVDESVNLGTDGNDLIVGGAGVDNVRAGGGDDSVDVKANTDRACGEKGVDTIHGGTEADEVWGGSGNDTLYGDNGADKLYGNDDNDTIYGGNDADAIEGNNGTDYAFGGNDVDVIVGGTRLAARADTGDFLFGDVGSDILIGDNGVPGESPSGATVYDLTDGNCAAPGDTCAHGGADTIYGGDGTDKAYGGLDNDHVYGGTAFDYIEGNPGADDLNGEAGEDDILGGTSQLTTGTALGIIGYADTTDTIKGGTNEDVILGDNGAISRPGAGNGNDFTQARGMTERLVTVYDWANADATKFGGDTINGNEDNDVVLGEGGGDTIHGDAGNDYLEGNQGADSVYGDAGQDDILGGSSQVANGAPKSGVTVDGELDTGDTLLSGGDGQDVILGDNGFVLTTGTVGETFLGTLEDMTKGHAGMTARRINLYDVKDTPAANTSGGDDITGDANDDVVFAQGGDDRVKGNGGDDHLQGGQGSDFVEGDTGSDDIVGGTAVILAGTTDTAGGVKDAADVLFGGDGNDVVSGDNAVIDRVQVTSPTAHGGADYTTKFTDRLNSDGSAIVTTRWFRRLDLRNGATYLTLPDAGRFGADRISGGSGVDMLFGQDGDDFVSGGPHDDYAEGNGGADSIRGDKYLGVAAPDNLFPPIEVPFTTDTVVPETTTPTALLVSWPGAPGTVTDLEGPTGADGQDDLIGGSTIQAFRDGNDTIEGDGEADFELGDNGALVRTYGIPDLGSGTRHYDVYAKRYPDGAVPTNAVIVRKGDATLGMTTTRFCTATQATCEPAGTFGNDWMYGDGGDDTQWGQDGDDTMRGGTERDDMYGELGDDYLYGDAGQDAMLGDRGGIVDTYINGSVPPDDAKFTSYTVEQNQPPAVSYTAFRPGTYDRRVDLYHDINGDAFVGSGTTAVMPHDGITEGGHDHIRGGGGHDSIHAGFGDDEANGDSGGDIVFGDRGADVLWGGKGCDTASGDPDDSAFATSATVCAGDHSIDRGVNDFYVDYVFGGQGGTSTESVNGALGSDIIDWHPRGEYVPDALGGCTTQHWPVTTGKNKNAVTVDPCHWLLMTGDYNDTTTDLGHLDNQSHHGVDWIYGGWDRDVMQADQADEGPNTGDRLLDWSGAYNLYSHCNPSYGGFNDVRQLSPAMLTFLQQWGYGVGLGQANADITTPGTSAYDEVAIVYQADQNDHGVGKDYPSTPGHFDDPNACTY